jgi:hypothetical protein
MTAQSQQMERPRTGVGAADLIAMSVRWTSAGRRKTIENDEMMQTRRIDPRGSNIIIGTI